MKKYIKPETLTVNIKCITPFLGTSDFTNGYSSSSQLSRESSFSSNEVVEE